MNNIKGYVDFEAWNNAAQININQSNNSLIINSDFFKIELDKINISESNYIYDINNKLIICYRGILISNLEKLVESYLKNQKEFLKNIPGFFSLVLIDLNKKEVILAADSVGLLRLYYISDKGKIFFSSRICDLPGDKFCKKGMIQFFLINYIADENTIFNNIKRVLPCSIIFFNGKGFNSYKYFDLCEYLLDISNSEQSISIEDTAYTLRDIVKDYVDSNSVTTTLTSGYDSRLLLAALLSNNIDIKSFTFGVNDNFEFKIAKQIAYHFENIKHYQIELNTEFEKFTQTYFDYIKVTKNLELNFNRYHYVYVWDEIKNKLSPDNLLTGICGDAFTRIVSTISNQTNKLLHKLIDTDNKFLTVQNSVNQKKDILNKSDLSIKESIDYILTLVNEMSENNSYYNHFYVKINFGVINYFGIELSTENNFCPTYPVFLDLRYLKALAASGASAFNKKLFYNRNKLKLKSHKYYYQIIKILCNDLNRFSTNRGFPLKYSSSLVYLPLRLFLYNKFKKKGYKTDLDYKVWRDSLNLPEDNNLSLDDTIKLEIISCL